MKPVLLPNGATVLAERIDYAADKHVVLARYGNNLVTWRLDEARNAYWGHYFGGDDIDKARRDFDIR